MSSTSRRTKSVSSKRSRQSRVKNMASDKSSEKSTAPKFKEFNLYQVTSATRLESLDLPTYFKIKDEPVEPEDYFGRHRYLKACKILDVIPANQLIATLDEEDLNMSHYPWNMSELLAINKALKINNIITTINLSDCNITTEGLVLICDALMGNDYIVMINLNNNRLHGPGISSLAELLEENDAIEELYLSNNQLDYRDMNVLLPTVIVHERLHTMDLSRNYLNEACALQLANLFKKNTIMRVLNLSWNHLTGIEARKMFTGLQGNVGLKDLNLSWNTIDKKSMDAFFKVLRKNEYLEKLDISNNRLDTSTAQKLARGLVKNQSLKVLKLYPGRGMSADGAVALIKTLMKETPVIEVLDLSGVTINPEFLKWKDKVMAKRPNLEIKLFGGSSGCYKVKPVDKKKLALTRMKNVSTEKKQDVFEFVRTLPDKVITKPKFRERLLELKLDEDLMNYILKELQNPKTKKIVQQEFRETFFSYFPDPKPPPNPEASAEDLAVGPIPGPKSEGVLSTEAKETLPQTSQSAPAAINLDKKGKKAPKVPPVA